MKQRRQSRQRNQVGQSDILSYNRRLRVEHLEDRRMLTGDPIYIVLDFNDVGQDSTTDINGNTVGDFDINDFGFRSTDYATVTNEILEEVRQDFFDELTSRMPVGRELNLEFVIGDVGVAPPGATEYYVIQVGSREVSRLNPPPFGEARLSSIRTSTGQHLDQFPEFNSGAVVGTVFSDQIANLSVLKNNNSELDDIRLVDVRHAVSKVTSHEIGHALSLLHVEKEGSVLPIPAATPIMATSLTGLEALDYVTENQFSTSATAVDDDNNPTVEVKHMSNSKTPSAYDLALPSRTLSIL